MAALVGASEGASVAVGGALVAVASTSSGALVSVAAGGAVGCSGTSVGTKVICAWAVEVANNSYSTAFVGSVVGWRNGVGVERKGRLHALRLMVISRMKPIMMIFFSFISALLGWRLC